MIERISALTLATHNMARALRFYQALVSNSSMAATIAHSAACGPAQAIESHHPTWAETGLVGQELTGRSALGFGVHRSNQTSSIRHPPSVVDAVGIDRQT